MIFNFSGGGGGAGLNFAIIGGVTKPTNPRKNTIWANTPTEITRWIFDANEPAEPEEGTLWIVTGTNSKVAFNVLKKDTLMVYPITCKQFVDGSWVDVPAESYISEEWVEWITYLFIESNGQAVPWVFKSMNTYGVVSEKNGVIVFEYATVNNSYMAAGTENVVDLSAYSKVRFDVEVRSNYTSGGGEFVIGVTSAQVVSEYNNNFVASEKPVADSIRKTISVDVSGISSGFISMYGIVNATIYNVWLE